MNTIRRLYLYAVAFVSLEVVLWGVVGLGRSLLVNRSIEGRANELAVALSLVLVGLPAFLLHWWLVQRSASQEIGEPSARLRAVFLYAVLLATLIPAVQNLLALASRLVFLVFRLQSSLALVGGEQTWGDNLIALVLNLLVAAYFYEVLRREWRLLLARPETGDDYSETRRLYRYLWLLYALGLVVIGLQDSLEFAFRNSGGTAPVALADGLALLVVGLPLLVALEWLLIRRSLVDQAERASQMRLVVLYALAFSGIATLLAAAALILKTLLNALFGAPTTLAELLFDLSRPLTGALSLGGIWLYYGRRLSVEVNDLPESPRRRGLRRLYYYVLALLGLAATLYGLDRLLLAVLNALSRPAAGTTEGLRLLFATALAYLLVGLPLWFFSWRPMQREATRSGEAGDHARRSLVRKAYLYAVLFAGVLGVMASAGELFYSLISAALGEAQSELGLHAAQVTKTLSLFVLLLVYHWQALQADARQAAGALARQHTLFPVLVLAPDDSAFTSELVHALQRQAPALPVAVHPYSQGVPDDTLSAAQAVILPAELLAKPPEALRLWLLNFPGTRLVIPAPLKDWYWLGAAESAPQSTASLVKQTALVVRRLAEGEALPAARSGTGWQTIANILAGLLVAEILFLLATFILSLIGQ